MHYGEKAFVSILLVIDISTRFEDGVFSYTHRVPCLSLLREIPQKQHEHLHLRVGPLSMMDLIKERLE